MGKEVGFAQSFVAALEIPGARVIRFTGHGGFSFGLEMRATRAGCDAWISAAIDEGLEPGLNRFRRLDESGEPVEYLYEIIVQVPTGWHGA